MTSMTPGAIRKRHQKKNPVYHVKREDGNVTLCRRPIFDNSIKVDELLVSCIVCKRISTKLAHQKINEELSIQMDSIIIGQIK